MSARERRGNDSCRTLWMICLMLSSEPGWGVSRAEFPHAASRAVKATTEATRTVFGENGKSGEKDSRPPATGRGSLPRSTGSLRRYRRLPK